MISIKSLFAFVLNGLFLAGCSDYRDIPPNDIGMMLTPSGYEDHIYSPGQVDIGEKEQGKGNRLVLLQRSGVEVKESFVGAESSEDREDHRCLLRDKSPLTLDVRLLLALPDYEKPQGRKDLARLFTLGNPKEVESTGRVLRITGASVYKEQAQQAVRGRVRQICTDYANFDAIFEALMRKDKDGLTAQIERAVSEVLEEKSIPLALVSAFPSNLKPDPSVTAAIAAQQAAAKRTAAIQTITDFLEPISKIIP
jgi:hypothetical protein